MPPEPKELTEVRELFARFEAKMDHPDGLVYLADALSLIADIQSDSESEGMRQVAANLPLTYAKKIRDRIEPLLSREPSVHWETVEHWQRVFAEFERSKFELPMDIVETLSKLEIKKIKMDVNLMSPQERKKFLNQLLGDVIL